MTTLMAELLPLTSWRKLNGSGGDPLGERAALSWGR